MTPAEAFVVAPKLAEAGAAASSRTASSPVGPPTWRPRHPHLSWVTVPSRLPMNLPIAMYTAACCLSALSPGMFSYSSGVSWPS